LKNGRDEVENRGQKRVREISGDVDVDVDVDIQIDTGMMGVKDGMGWDGMGWDEMG
jgi:hypothetical protein